MNYVKEKTVQDLLALTQALMQGDFSKRAIVNVDDSELSQICINLNAFADKLQLQSSPAEDVKISIDEFIDVISSYANRNFEKKLPISEQSNFLDALATGINILGEELEYTTVSKNELEIERNELKIAKEKAEEANKLKSAFLGNLSHEIRTPLQGIYGFAELLESSSTDETQRREYLNIIKKRANDLQNIIESLLDMASLETGEIKSYPTEENLKSLLDDIFESFRQEQALHKPSVSIEIENKLNQGSWVKIDATHLKRVIMNLLGNSMKFTRQGKILLKARTTADNFLIEVEDTGVGVAPEKLHLIFEPFRQAHEGMSRSRGGIGLGLAICKKMVALWGGEITAQSSVGKGSVFSFTIPHRN